jgi:hypothetical protein
LQSVVGASCASPNWAIHIAPDTMDGEHKSSHPCRLPTSTHILQLDRHQSVQNSTQIELLGIRRESFDLEVPLQVVHMSPDGVSDQNYLHGYPIIGPVGEDPRSLEFRRASATSWFSDETLVTLTSIAQSNSLTYLVSGKRRAASTLSAIILRGRIIGVGLQTTRMFACLYVVYKFPLF